MKTLQKMMVIAGLVLPLAHSGATAQLDMPRAEKHVVSREAMDRVLGHYAKIQQALAEGRLSGVSDHVALLIPAARDLGDPRLSEAIGGTARELMAVSGGGGSSLGSIAQAREKFKKLSAPIVRWIKDNRLSDWSVIHCPMAGASWVQRESAPIENPYFGKEMLACGEKVR